MANELDGIDFQCAPPQLAPYGPNYTGPAGCAITGGLPGATSIAGSDYLDAALQFSKSHVWRNWGIVMAWWIAYVALGCLAIESIPAAGSTKGVTVYKSGSTLPTRDVREENDRNTPEAKTAVTNDGA
jgi:ATP-binding cassette subfamily G (WHITE) protein 2 (SNQ2)